MRTKSFAAFLLATPALFVTPALAGEVLMLDHTPSVEELRGYLAPEPARRTRGIEIVGQAPAAAAAPSPATQASATFTAQPEQTFIAQPIAAPEPVPESPEPTTIGYRIQFAYDSSEIGTESRPFLDQLGQVLQSEPKLTLAVEGHTDAHGSADYNKGLSERRAKAVQGYLETAWHIPAKRLKVIGKGEAEPLAEDPNGAENRRVQFRPMG